MYEIRRRNVYSGVLILNFRKREENKESENYASFYASGPESGSGKWAGEIETRKGTKRQRQLTVREYINSD